MHLTSVLKPAFKLKVLLLFTSSTDMCKLDQAFFVRGRISDLTTGLLENTADDILSKHDCSIPFLLSRNNRLKSSADSLFSEEAVAGSEGLWLMNRSFLVSRHCSNKEIS